MLWQHYEETIAWRVLHLSWLRRGDEGHTVLVQDVPTTNVLEASADLVSNVRPCSPAVTPPPRQTPHVSANRVLQRLIRARAKTSGWRCPLPRRTRAPV